MTRVLLLGYDPSTVDFSDPALPTGMTAAKIHAGIEVAMKEFASRGWEADLCSIRPDETAGPTVERQLASASYDCIVIGAGVRLPPRLLSIFEVVINTVRKAAPPRRLPSTRGPTTAPMRPHDGCRIAGPPNMRVRSLSNSLVKEC